MRGSRDATVADCADRQLAIPSVSGLGGDQGKSGESNLESDKQRFMGDPNRFSIAANIQVNPCFEEEIEDLDFSDPKKRKRSFPMQNLVTTHAANNEGEEATEDLMDHQYFLTAVPGNVLRGCRE